MLTPDAVPGWLGPGDLALAGDGAERLRPHLPQARLLPDLALIDTAMLARLAAHATVIAPPLPFYIRPPDAKPARRA